MTSLTALLNKPWNSTMSDEYHDSGQYKGSLVQESVKDTLPTGNYPPSGDTTSEGGSSGDTLSRNAQRGIDNTNIKSQEKNAPTVTVSTSPTPNSFNASKLQPTENKSTDHPGSENSEPCDSSRYADRREETYESAAAGEIYATET